VPVVDTIAGSAALPAATVVMPVTPRVLENVPVVNAPVDGVVAPTVPFITAPVSVLLVSVSVPASVANVPVTIGSVIVGVPATAGVTIVAVPDVLPVIATAVALTDLPAVRLLTATLTVTPDCTIGNTSVPPRGVVAAVRSEIFMSAMIYLRLHKVTKV